MEFLSLNRRRSSSRNAPSGEEQGETAVFAGYMMTSHSDLFRLRSLLCSFRPRKSVSIYPRSAFVYGPTISAIFLDYALLEICLTTIGKILVLYYCRVSDKTAWLIRKKKKKEKKKNEKISKGGFLSTSVAALIAGSTSIICRKSWVTLFNERSFFLFNAPCIFTFFSLQVRKHSWILPKDAAASANSYTSLAFILNRK